MGSSVHVKKSKIETNGQSEEFQKLENCSTELQNSFQEQKYKILAILSRLIRRMSSGIQELKTFWELMRNSATSELLKTESHFSRNSEDYLTINKSYDLDRSIRIFLIPAIFRKSISEQHCHYNL